jgi:hypothetical protein
VGDIAGLSPGPPGRAVVPCADGKARVRALDRTRPLPPPRPGRAERRARDHERHGTAALGAAPDERAGTVIGRCAPRHRASEPRRFPDEAGGTVPADPDVHAATGNAGGHETKLVRDWSAARPRRHVRRTPTPSSWVDQVERSFALLTDEAPRRGVRRSTAGLEAAIRASVEGANAEPEPFRWTKSADATLAAIERFRRRTPETDQRSRRTSESGR